MTALMASDVACLPISPASSKHSEVWISLEVMVQRLLEPGKSLVSWMMPSNISITKEFMMFMASCERLKPIGLTLAPWGNSW